MYFNIVLHRKFWPFCFLLTYKRLSIPQKYNIYIFCQHVWALAQIFLEQFQQFIIFLKPNKKSMVLVLPFFTFQRYDKGTPYYHYCLFDNGTCGFNNQTVVLIGDKELKISLCIDNMVVYLTNGACAMQVLLSILQEFGEMSGLQINSSKLEIFPIDIEQNQEKQIKSVFKSHQYGITLEFIFLFLCLNYLIVISLIFFQQVKTQLKDWREEKISWLDRFNLLFCQNSYFCFHVTYKHFRQHYT